MVTFISDCRFNAVPGTNGTLLKDTITDPQRRALEDSPDYELGTIVQAYEFPELTEWARSFENPQYKVHPTQICTVRIKGADFRFAVIESKPGVSQPVVPYIVPLPLECAFSTVKSPYPFQFGDSNLPLTSFQIAGFVEGFSSQTKQVVLVRQTEKNGQSVREEVVLKAKKTGQSFCLELVDSAVATAVEFKNIGASQTIAKFQSLHVKPSEVITTRHEDYPNVIAEKSYRFRVVGRLGAQLAAKDIFLHPKIDGPTWDQLTFLNNNIPILVDWQAWQNKNFPNKPSSAETPGYTYKTVVMVESGEPDKPPYIDASESSTVPTAKRDGTHLSPDQVVAWARSRIGDHGDGAKSVVYDKDTGEYQLVYNPIEKGGDRCKSPQLSLANEVPGTQALSPDERLYLAAQIGGVYQFFTCPTGNSASPDHSALYYAGGTFEAGETPAQLFNRRLKALVKSQPALVVVGRNDQAQWTAKSTRNFTAHLAAVSDAVNESVEHGWLYHVGWSAGVNLGVLATAHFALSSGPLPVVAVRLFVKKFVERFGQTMGVEAAEALGMRLGIGVVGGALLGGIAIGVGYSKSVNASEDDGAAAQRDCHELYAALSRAEGSVGAKGRDSRVKVDGEIKAIRNVLTQLIAIDDFNDSDEREAFIRQNIEHEGGILWRLEKIKQRILALGYRDSDIKAALANINDLHTLLSMFR